MSTRHAFKIDFLDEEMDLGNSPVTEKVPKDLHQNKQSETKPQKKPVNADKPVKHGKNKEPKPSAPAPINSSKRTKMEDWWLNKLKGNQPNFGQTVRPSVPKGLRKSHGKGRNTVLPFSTLKHIFLEFEIYLTSKDNINIIFGRNSDGIVIIDKVIGTTVSYCCYKVVLFSHVKIPIFFL